MSAMRRILTPLVAAFVLLVAAAPPASAHSVSGVGATNLHTNLQAVTPEISGLDIQVVEFGSRFQVVNRTSDELLVLGYTGEPYLRIGPQGVFENERSPATYINASRKGTTKVPDKAKAGATPEWRKIASEPIARWHDHRVHWMLPTDPPAARQAPKERHVIIPQWVVNMRMGDKAIAVTGDLEWVPGGSPFPWLALAAVLFALVIVVRFRPAWGPGLAAVTAVLVAVDIFHSVGLGLANAGSLGTRLTKIITGSPFAPVGWVAGGLAIFWLAGRRSDGLPLAAVAGLLVAIAGGLADLSVLSRSEVPFAFPADVARLVVTASIGLGAGLAVAAALLSLAPADGRRATPRPQTEAT